MEGFGLSWVLEEGRWTSSTVEVSDVGGWFCSSLPPLSVGIESSRWDMDFGVNWRWHCGVHQLLLHGHTRTELSETTTTTTT